MAYDEALLPLVENWGFQKTNIVDRAILPFIFVLADVTVEDC